MILFTENGKQIRGDLIKQATLRSDLAPIPMTLEADIRDGDGTLGPMLAVDKIIKLPTDDEMRIVKSVKVIDRGVQGARLMETYRITALLSPCCAVSFVRGKAIIKETAALSAIYQSAGATIKSIDADFPVPRFYCPVGDTPTFHIARVLQEEGGCVRWRNRKLQFLRLPDIFKQKPVIRLPDNATDEADSGFLERHEVPWFFSIKDSGDHVFGNRDKQRSVRYVPFKDQQQLRNMTRCLVQRKIIRVTFDIRLCAGDLVEFMDGRKFAVITAAHAYITGTDDGGDAETYTRLWLGSLEE